MKYALTLLILFLSLPAHAFVGEGFIGFVISATQPTSTAPDNTSYGDDDDD